MIEFLGLAAGQPTLFEGDPVLANSVRVVTVGAGLIFAAIAFKVAFLGWWRSRRHPEDPDAPDSLGTLAFGLGMAVPAINGFYRFDEPLLAVTTVVYIVALVLAVVAIARRVTLRRRSGSQRQRRGRAT